MPMANWSNAALQFRKFFPILQIQYSQTSSDFQFRKDLAGKYFKTNQKCHARVKQNYLNNITDWFLVFEIHSFIFIPTTLSFKYQDIKKLIKLPCFVGRKRYISN